MGPYLGVCIVSLSRCLYLCLIVVVVWGAGSTGQDPLTSSSSLKRKLWYPERERDRETERQRDRERHIDLKRFAEKMIMVPRERERVY